MSGPGTSVTVPVTSDSGPGTSFVITIIYHLGAYPNFCPLCLDSTSLVTLVVGLFGPWLIRTWLIRTSKNFFQADSDLSRKLIRTSVNFSRKLIRTFFPGWFGPVAQAYSDLFPGWFGPIFRLTRTYFQADSDLFLTNFQDRFLGSFGPISRLIRTDSQAHSDRFTQTFKTQTYICQCKKTTHILKWFCIARCYILLTYFREINIQLMVDLNNTILLF